MARGIWFVSHFFARCASQKTHGHARIARVSTKSDTSGHCLVCSVIALAVLSRLGRCWTHTWSRLHLSFHSHRPYQLRSYNQGCPIIMPDHLQLLPNAEYLPFKPENKLVCVSVYKNQIVQLIENFLFCSLCFLVVGTLWRANTFYTLSVSVFVRAVCFGGWDLISVTWSVKSWMYCQIITDLLNWSWVENAISNLVQQL